MDKTVLITGSSRGIGRAAARRFAEHGWRVAVHCHRETTAAQALVEELTGRGLQAQAFQADIGSFSEAARLIREATERFGPLDALINNAGIASAKLLTDYTEEEWDELFRVNVKSLFNCCHAVLPSMISRKSGTIVNLSSMWGQAGASCEVPYSAAKAAVIGFTKALAKELGPSGITVNCVAPGFIDTDMNAHLAEEDRAALKEETPLGRVGTPDDVAGALYYLCSSSASFITGQVLAVNGGFVI